MPSVWIYPEKVWAELGSRRWVAEWYVLKPSAEAKLAADPEYEWDPHGDLTLNRTVHTNQAAARRAARKVADGSMFGTAEVKQQVVDWYVEEDRIAEWADCGDVEEIVA